jgi:hypothetical protein
LVSAIDAHEGLRGEGGKQSTPHQSNFKRRVHKTAIKSKIVDPLAIFVRISLTPRDFGKNLSYPVPWIFNLCASMVSLCGLKRKKSTTRKKTLRIEIR